MAHRPTIRVIRNIGAIRALWAISVTKTIRATRVIAVIRPIRATRAIRVTMTSQPSGQTWPTYDNRAIRNIATIARNIALASKQGNK